MSIPLGHKLKILKRIKDLRTERGMNPTPSREGNLLYDDKVALILPVTAEKGKNMASLEVGS